MTRRSYPRVCTTSIPVIISSAFELATTLTEDKQRQQQFLTTLEVLDWHWFNRKLIWIYSTTFNPFVLDVSLFSVVHRLLFLLACLAIFQLLRHVHKDWIIKASLEKHSWSAPSLCNMFSRLSRLYLYRLYLYIFIYVVPPSTKVALKWGQGYDWGSFRGTGVTSNSDLQ